MADLPTAWDPRRRLSPSAAERWLSCPASAKLIAELDHEPPESVYAAEGTMAHTLGYLKAALHFKQITKREYNRLHKEWASTTPVGYQDDMHRYTDLYVELLQEIAERYDQVTVLLEQKFETGVPHCRGLGDAVLVSSECIHVVDLKYGRGVAVSAEDNPQLKLYGVGVYDTFDLLGEIKTIAMTIFQPRLGSTSTYYSSAEELVAWRRDTVLPRAELALGDDAPFGPSKAACRFCPVAGECKPRMRHILDLDFGQPDLLTPQELADAHRRLDEIRDWCNAIELTALSKAYSEGVHLPGLKVVLSGGRRSIADTDQAVKVLTAAGYNVEQVARLGIKPLGELEKLVGKRELPTLLGDLLIRSEGKPSLVDENDPRPEIDAVAAAVKDFT